MHAYKDRADGGSVGAIATIARHQRLMAVECAGIRWFVCMAWPVTSVYGLVIVTLRCEAMRLLPNPQRHKHQGLHKFMNAYTRMSRSLHV